MFRVTPRVLEGTRPLISSLYLPYSIIKRRLATTVARMLVISHVQNASCSICIMVLTPIPASVMRLQDAI